MSYGDQWQPPGYGSQADQPYGHTGGQPPGAWPQGQQQASAPPGYSPVSAQPVYAPPGYPQQPYGQPAAPQPAPAYPGYQPAGYQQPPAQWQPQYPGQPPHPHWQQPVPAAPPRPRSRAGLWIGLAAGATALVVIAGCGIAVAFMRSTADTLGSTAPPSLDSLAPTEAAPKKPAREVELVRPDTIGDRKRITQGEYATKASKAEKQLKSSLSAGATLVVGYYGTTDQKADQIYIVGSTIPGPLRRATFDKQFTESGPAIGGKPVTGTVEVATPASVGFTKCGQTTKAGMTVALCAFSNQYDYVVVQWYNRRLSDDIKQEIATIRTLVEK